MSTDPGWAIRRNGSCLLTKEVDCGGTVGTYRACCPSSTTCPSQYNVACCPAGMNCTMALVETPSCANSSWTMFDNGGYFCCESGQVGYNLRNTNGCSRSGQALPQDAMPLAVVSQIFSTTSTSTSPPSAAPTSTSSTASSAISPTSSPETSNTTPGGTIAGAVVGSIAGIAVIAGLLWFFLRKKKSSRMSMTADTSASASASPGGVPQPLYKDREEDNQYVGVKPYGGYYATGPAEIGGTPKAELSANMDSIAGRSEMP